MNYDIGTALNEAIERVGTQAGGVVIAALTALGVAWTAAQQDIARNNLEEFTSTPAEELFPQDPATGAEIQRSIEQMYGTMEFPLAVGMSQGTASLVTLLAYVAALVVVIVAIDAFANERDALDGLGTGSLGWKTLNLFLGTIAMIVLVGVGLVLVVVPGIVVGAVLLYFPVAIAVDGENFVSAFGSSVDVASDNVVGTIVLAAVWAFAWIGAGFAGWLATAVVPGALGAIVNELLRTVAWVFVLALITRAYVQATGDGDGTTVEDPGETDEEWTHTV